MTLPDTPAESRFDRIAALAAATTHMPVALLSLCEDQRQWVEAAFGEPTDELSREESIRAIVVEGGKPLVVSDLRADRRLASLAIVTSEPYFRSCAGVPLRSSGGVVGSLCVFDTVPRRLGAELQILEDLASLAEAELENQALNTLVHSLERRKTHLSALMEIIPDAIIEIGPRGNIVDSNAAAHSLIGADPCGEHDADSMSIGTLLPDYQRVGRRARDSELGASALDLVLVTRSGERAPVQVQACRFRDSGRAGELLVIRDMRTKAAGEIDAQRERRHTEKVLSTMRDGMVRLDRHGVVRYINPAAARLLGHRAADLKGRSMHHVAHSHRPDGSSYPPDECPVKLSSPPVSGGQALGETFWAHDGSPTVLNVMWTPLIEGDQVEGTVLMLSDAHERDEAERRKDEFIALVSHELRTPLTSIRGSLGLLMTGAFGQLPDAADELVAMAIRSVDRLSKLVADILDIERLSLNKMRLECAQVDGFDVLHQVATQLAPLAHDRSVKLLVRGEPAELHADAHRLTQVLTNIVGNAIKFSPVGGVVEMVAENKPGDVLLSITDRGRGIAQQDIERVFDRFVQQERTDTTVHGGTGLGLPIARSLVELHQGTLSVSSREGLGSTFLIELPKNSHLNEEATL